MSNLPRCWTLASLSNIIEDYQAGFASGVKDVKNGLRHLRMNNIDINGKLNLELLRTVPISLAKGYHLLQKGDILVCTTNSSKLVGKCAMFDQNGDFAFSNHLTRLRVNVEIVNNRFLQFYLFFLWQSGEFEKLCKHWVNQSSIPKEKLLSLDVLLPPLNEQNCIVAKLEKLLSRVDACQERLNKIPAILKRFRQSVLAAACSGRLTADWREKNECAVAADYSQDALYDLPPLPETWLWQPLATVCEKVVDCPHSTPKWTNSGRLCVRTTNFKPGLLDLTEVRYVADETFMERIERVKPQPGDILYSREGGILGIACMIPTGVELCLGQRMMLFRPNPKFTGVLLMHWLNSPAILHRIQELIGGSASPHLNVKDIKNFPTPVPRFAEQQEITRRVEALFKIADQIEERYKKSKAYIDKLTQSILAKAFRGELIPQVPNCEPTTAMLERMQTTKLSGASSSKSHRTCPSRKMV